MVFITAVHKSLQKLTPIRGRKHPGSPGIRTSSITSMFTKANPDKGTETIRD